MTKNLENAIKLIPQSESFIESLPNDWILRFLCEVGHFKKGKGIPKSQIVNKGFPCVRYGEIYTSYDFVVEEFRSFIDEVNTYDSQEIKYGDILFTGSGETIDEIGKAVTYIGRVNAYAGGDIIILSPNNSLVNSEFLSYVLETDFVRRQKRRFGQGQQVVHIYADELKKIVVPLTSLSEQRRIASCLKNWEVSIHKINKLITQKELKRKWLMQVLLTEKKRLKGFDEEWIEVTMRDIFCRITRKNNEENTNVMTISAQKGFVRQTDFFTKTVASESLTDYFLIEKGEFCYNKSYSNGYDWGATKRLNDFNKAVVTTLYICFKLKNDDHSGDFFEQYFECNLLNKGLTKIAHEGGRAHGLLNVTPHDFFSLKIKIPSKNEQIAIANVLNTADRELLLLRSRLEKIKDQKRGLMQVLLTGEKRFLIK